MADESRIEGLKTRIRSSAEYAREHGEPLVRQAAEKGQAALTSKLGKRIATGALAGGAIAYAIPLAAISTGAILGAGAMVFFKAVRDDED